jgi:hypothetical protein
MEVTEAEHTYKPASSKADFIYGATYSAALGGSAVALAFLAIDSLAGRALFTPSLLGSVLFFGASAETFTGIDLTAVALWTVVHFAGFLVMGSLASWLHQRLRAAGTGATLTTLTTFAAIVVLGEVMFLVASATVMPGVAERLGHALILGANVVAAAVMAPFMRWAYRQGRDPEQAGSVSSS